jgi:prepilin-type N-terminal cleavage/methylation domain-containing protein
MTLHVAQPAPAARRRRGFTLIEAAMVTVIIGVGVMSMLQLLAAGTAANEDAAELTIAINLANNIHEITLGMPYYDPQTPTVWNSKEPTVAEWDNITDLDGATFNPPVDARRNPIPEYAGWRQSVEVESVTHDKVTVTTPDTTAEPTARVTVTVRHRGRTVYATSWLVVAPKGN